MAVVKPLRALRYGAAADGPLERLVGPPYDILSAQERDEYRARSPHNVVHLTLPDDVADAGRLWREWRRDGVLVGEEPAFWALSQEYVGPDGVPRTRNGLVAALRLEPYANGVVLPHERTDRAPKEGRLQLLRAVRAELEPIFLLHDGPTVEPPAREPDLAAAGARLWRLDEDLEPRFADRQLLIADGHHRYETALAYHAEEGSEASSTMMVVLVSTAEPGLMIFPTHRIVERLGDTNGSEPAAGIRDALARLDELPRDRPAVALYRNGEARILRGDEPEVDAAFVQRFEPQGVAYTPRAEEAVAAVDSGRAEAAFLLRPPTIEQVRAVAARGETMPQKSTYFYPKLVSGLLFQPLD